MTAKDLNSSFSFFRCRNGIKVPQVRDQRAGPYYTAYYRNKTRKKEKESIVSARIVRID